MAGATEQELRTRVSKASTVDATWLGIEAISDQAATLRDDVARLRAHPLLRLPASEVGLEYDDVPASTRAPLDRHVAAAGFIYDVDTGLLEQVA